jgi:hypothetical protein
MRKRAIAPRLLRPSVAVLAALALICAGSFVGSAKALGTTHYVAPGLPGVDLNCSSPGFNSIQFAVSASSAGDTIVVCDGTYNEQVTISKSLTLAGSGNAIIQPAVPAADLNVVDVTGGTTSVTMSGFTVAGPGPSGCNSIHTGIAVFGGASLDLSNTTVRGIRDTGLSGCQKNGIVIAGSGSTGKITNTTTSGIGPTGSIAQNGIEVVNGAAATISTSTIRDHAYTTKGTTACGLLIIAAGGVNDANNVYLNNQRDKCTVNGRGGTFEG